MNFRPMLIVNGLLVAGMAAASAWGWKTIPDGTRVPIRWDLEGNPSAFAEKTEFLILLPAAALALTALFWLLPRFDPRRANLEASARFWNAGAISVAGLLAYLHVLLIANGSGYNIDILNALVPGLSFLFIGIGNYLGKTRSNWFGGVRTPWTMSSDYSWEKTHRWAGRMMVASGVAGIVAWFAIDARFAFLVLVGAIIASMVVSFALSYVFWRSDPTRTESGTH